MCSCVILRFLVAQVGWRCQQLAEKRGNPEAEVGRSVDTEGKGGAGRHTKRRRSAQTTGIAYKTVFFERIMKGGTIAKFLLRLFGQTFGHVGPAGAQMTEEKIFFSSLGLSRPSCDDRKYARFCNPRQRRKQDNGEKKRFGKTTFFANTGSNARSARRKK